jgi:hypothetical protein
MAEQQEESASNSTSQLTLPLFDGANSSNQADLWPKWLLRFERYRIASGLNNKSDMEQVSTLSFTLWVIVLMIS